MARYGQQSQRLDQSFPKRLLSSQPLSLSMNDLKDRVKELDDKRVGLKEIGLLDKACAWPDLRSVALACAAPWLGPAVHRAGSRAL